MFLSICSYFYRVASKNITIKASQLFNILLYFYFYAIEKIVKLFMEKLEPKIEAKRRLENFVHAQQVGGE